MSWLNIFKKGDILTQHDRDELEDLEQKAQPFIKIRGRIDEDFIHAQHRIGKLQELAGKLVEDVENEGLYQRMLFVAAMPSDIRFGFQHHNCVAEAFDRKIQEIRQPSAEIVRRVFRRALSLAEAELKRTESKERKEAEVEGFPYLPSGRVQALQNRVLGLRNAIEAKYQHEGSIQDQPHWKERLKEWL